MHTCVRHVLQTGAFRTINHHSNGLEISDVCHVSFRESSVTGLIFSGTDKADYGDTETTLRTKPEIQTESYNKY